MQTDDESIRSNRPHPLDEPVEDDAPPPPAISDEPVGGDEGQPRLGGYQFSLLGLFGLMTVCGVYFFLERVHEGRLAIVILGGMAVVVVVLLPAFWFFAWLVDLARDGGGALSMLLFTVIVAGGVLAGLVFFWGM